MDVLPCERCFECGIDPGPAVVGLSSVGGDVLPFHDVCQGMQSSPGSI
jgi:hypothetical protein